LRALDISDVREGQRVNARVRLHALCVVVMYAELAHNLGRVLAHCARVAIRP